MLLRRGRGKRRNARMAVRTIVLLIWLLVGLAPPLLPAAAQLTDGDSLGAFARQAGVHDIRGFVETLQTLRMTHHLPARYISKEEAGARGWHGGGLCEVWPGHVIGGDIFHDAGGPLPRGPGIVYREADIDSDCRGRGGKRLIFSSDGRSYLTVDHYRTFQLIP